MSAFRISSATVNSIYNLILISISLGEQFFIPFFISIWCTYEIWFNIKILLNRFLIIRMPIITLASPRFFISKTRFNTFFIFYIFCMVFAAINKSST